MPSRKRPLAERVALVNLRRFGAATRYFDEEKKLQGYLAYNCMADARRIIKMVREHDKGRRDGE